MQVSSGYGTARPASFFTPRQSFGPAKTTVTLPLVKIPGYSSVHVTPAQAQSFRYTSYYPRLPNMVGLGAVSPSMVGAGASAGTAIMPGVGTAIGALIGAAAGMFGGKVHYSPWNFVYDDYPQHIYQNEIQLNGLRNAIAQFTGAPQTPDPPMYSKKGGPQYQASMLAIVPKYVPGAEGQIAAYDRRLNEAGGAYENTVKLQIALAPQLQSQLQNLQMTSRPVAFATPAGSPTNYGPTPTQPQPYQMQPVPIQPQTPYNPYAQPVPVSYSPGGAPIPPGVQTSGMFDMGGYTPILLGGLALLGIFAFGADRNDRVTRARPRPRRR